MGDASISKTLTADIALDLGATPPLSQATAASTDNFSRPPRHEAVALQTGAHAVAQQDSGAVGGTDVLRMLLRYHCCTMFVTAQHLLPYRSPDVRSSIAVDASLVTHRSQHHVCSTPESLPAALRYTSSFKTPRSIRDPICSVGAGLLQMICVLTVACCRHKKTHPAELSSPAEELHPAVPSDPAKGTHPVEGSLPASECHPAEGSLSAGMPHHAERSDLTEPSDQMSSALKPKESLFPVQPRQPASRASEPSKEMSSALQAHRSPRPTQFRQPALMASQSSPQGSVALIGLMQPLTQEVDRLSHTGHAAQSSNPVPATDQSMHGAQTFDQGSVELCTSDEPSVKEESPASEDDCNNCDEVLDENETDDEVSVVEEESHEEAGCGEDVNSGRHKGQSCLSARYGVCLCPHGIYMLCYKLHTMHTTSPNAISRQTQLTCVQVTLPLALCFCPTDMHEQLIDCCWEHAFRNAERTTAKHHPNQQ